MVCTRTLPYYYKHSHDRGILIRNDNTCKKACTQYGVFPGTLSAASVCRGRQPVYVYVNSKYFAGWLTGSEVVK